MTRQGRNMSISDVLGRPLIIAQVFLNMTLGPHFLTFRVWGLGILKEMELKI